MAGTVTAAKAASVALKLLLSSGENGEHETKNRLTRIAAGIMCFILLLTGAAIDLFISNPLMSGMLPDELTEVMEREFNRPVIQTGQQGMLPLPVEISTVSSLYGWRVLRGSSNFHEGIDFPVSFDSPIMAIAPGKVVVSGIDVNYGEYIMLEHHMERYDREDELIDTETFYSLYAHLYKRYVFRGQSVDQRQQIATSGGDPSRQLITGNVTGPHLHLSLFRTPAFSSHFDPYDYLLNPDPFDGETKSIQWITE